MKLAYLCIDDMIAVPGGKLVGEDIVGDACESTFRAADGWELHEVTPGVFTIRAPHMPAAMVVGGHGYRYIAAPPEPVGTEAPMASTCEQLSAVVPAKGKRR